MTAWTEHIKAFAKEHNTTYGCALSNPECSASYRAKRPQKLTKKEKKEVSGMETQDTNVAKKATITAVAVAKRKAGRPKKYATAEEARKVKIVQSIASNKRRANAKKHPTMSAAAAGLGVRNSNNANDSDTSSDSDSDSDSDNGDRKLYPITQLHLTKIIGSGGGASQVRPENPEIPREYRMPPLLPVQFAMSNIPSEDEIINANRNYSTIQRLWAGTNYAAFRRWEQGLSYQTNRYRPVQPQRTITQDDYMHSLLLRPDYIRRFYEAVYPDLTRPNTPL